MNDKYFSRIKNISNIIKPIYQSNNVFFHDYSHIEYGLEMMNKLPSNIKVNDNQLIAWLFHDIVYDVSSKTNEEDSAKFFLSFYNDNTTLFEKFDLDLNHVSNIILDTKNHTSFHSDQSPLILDIDMSCLSGDYEVFKKGRENVLKEYSMVYDEKSLLEGTLSFLNYFKDNKIFITDYFIENHELNAHENISLYLVDIFDYFKDKKS